MRDTGVLIAMKRGGGHLRYYSTAYSRKTGWFVKILLWRGRMSCLNTRDSIKASGHGAAQTGRIHDGNPDSFVFFKNPCIFGSVHT